MEEVRQIIQKYIKDRGVNGKPMTYGKLATTISDTIGVEIGREAVCKWSQGKNKPRKETLVLLTMKDKGWLGDMALELLAVIDPEVWG